METNQSFPCSTSPRWLHLKSKGGVLDSSTTQAQHDAEGNLVATCRRADEARRSGPLTPIIFFFETGVTPHFQNERKQSIVRNNGIRPKSSEIHADKHVHDGGVRLEHVVDDEAIMELPSETQLAVNLFFIILAHFK
jgi:hypothetical protein